MGGWIPPVKQMGDSQMRRVRPTAQILRSSDPETFCTSGTTSRSRTMANKRGWTLSMTLISSDV